MYQPSPKLKVWASEIDDGTIRQAEMTSRLDIVYDHVSLMPDAHVGIGSTVGSVIPFKGAIVPATVGVDIGCGMIAVKTAYTVEDLPNDLDRLMPLVEKRIPAGVGQGHQTLTHNAGSIVDSIGWPATGFTSKQWSTAYSQFGSLGSGNHFVEVCIGLDGHVWCVLHSGSRGIGNQIGTYYINEAKSLAKLNYLYLEDLNLAYFIQGTSEFDLYIHDMLWAQEYAFRSRDKMMNALLRSLVEVVGRDYGRDLDRINCHHNFTQKETFDGQELWVTRKGAIKAYQGDRGIIPGSMGTDTYIVSGKGVQDAWCSCSHGAGRRMSRGQARREIKPEQLREQMRDVSVWNEDHAKSLVDESPLAYKDIARVMKDQADLVTIDDRLYQVFNYKGQ
jgi:RNA-splicing ligase RtcB